MSGNLPNFREEQSAKIPALTLLTNLGYQFIPPSECMVMRGNKTTVILPQVLRKVLSFKTYSFMGRDRHLSEAAMDKIVQELANPAMNEGLKAANEKLYNALTYGISVTEFVEGKKPTQPFKSSIGTRLKTINSISPKKWKLIMLVVQVNAFLMWSVSSMACRGW